MILLQGEIAYLRGLRACLNRSLLSGLQGEASPAGGEEEELQGELPSTNTQVAPHQEERERNCEGTIHKSHLPQMHRVGEKEQSLTETRFMR
eukprot:c41153_g1_i1 orf=329-604(+)